MEGDWWQYSLVFLVSLSLSGFLTPLFLRLATRIGILDRPGGRKSHNSPVPYLGGGAIVVAFGGAVLVGAAIESPPDGLSELAWVIAAATFLAVVGLIDDLRNLPVASRLLAQLLCALCVWKFGVSVALTGSEGVDLALTLLWFVGITNAFNLLDNMDGLAAGLAAINCLTFSALAIDNTQYLVATLGIALAGCSLGFLRHNFFPARIYMGDSGSLFLGFMVAYLGIKLRADGPVTRSFVVPVLVCSFAVLDTTVVVASRLWYGRSPLQPGRDHLSHRLVKVGLPVPIAVGATYLAASVVGVAGFVVSRIDLVSAWILVTLVSVCLAGIACLAWMVPVYPESRQRRYTIAEGAQSGRHPASGNELDNT